MEYGNYYGYIKYDDRYFVLPKQHTEDFQIRVGIKRKINAKEFKFYKPDISKRYFHKNFKTDYIKKMLVNNINLGDTLRIVFDHTFNNYWVAVAKDYGIDIDDSAFRIDTVP